MTSTHEAHLPLPEGMLREDRLNYTPVPGSVTLARHRAARLITEWGRPELAWATGLVVSELGTNALLHGCLRDRLFQVAILLRPALFRIEVSDPRGERLPTLRAADDGECFGRGLPLVVQITDRWGTESRTVGKTVYAEIDLKPPTAP
ncbi:ATP-binding protein [Streptomyces paludis]|uniref:ATP-binding protein n=1 Tax=Streptomyces paludis TaxID=2282738 RepID=A0A345HT47_9ACTN|nr:ATP-binding protein [Streptomyces paludis]AXG79871.1 ATP-binding protein [Streptomyces paludis]